MKIVNHAEREEWRQKVFALLEQEPMLTTKQVMERLPGVTEWTAYKSVVAFRIDNGLPVQMYKTYDHNSSGRATSLRPGKKPLSVVLYNTKPLLEAMKSWQVPERIIED